MFANAWRALVALAVAMLFLPRLAGWPPVLDGLAVRAGLLALLVAVITEMLAPDAADFWTKLGEALIAFGRVLVDVGLAVLVAWALWRMGW